MIWHDLRRPQRGWFVSQGGEIHAFETRRLSQSGSFSWQVYGDLYARVKRYYNVLDVLCKEQLTIVTYAQNPKSERRKTKERVSWIERAQR